MSGKRISFKQRVNLQNYIENDSYNNVKQLADIIGISRKQTTKIFTSKTIRMFIFKTFSFCM